MDCAGFSIGSVSASGLVVTLDTSVYRLDAIKKAAYKFGNRCHIQIEPVNTARVQVLMKPRHPAQDDGERLACEFCNEALDQELRSVVAEETEGIRNLLLAEAFSKTSLIQQESETADYRDDPAGIASPDSGQPVE